MGSCSAAVLSGPTPLATGDEQGVGGQEGGELAARVDLERGVSVGGVGARLLIPTVGKGRGVGYRRPPPSGPTTTPSTMRSRADAPQIRAGISVVLWVRTQM